MKLRKMFAKVGEKVKSFFSSKKNVIVTAAVIATVLAGIFGLRAYQVAVSAPSPRFNFLPGDAEMLQVANISQDSAWSDPLNATNGDRVAFLFYYHNGVVNSVAHNTHIRVDLPTGQGNSLNFTSYLWSDETSYISDTIVDSKIVGLSGATINLPSNARIKYVSGSTKLFSNGAQVGIAQPDGITSASGLNIGDIKGCWKYSGYVTFLADIYGQSNLVLDKTVAHSGESAWHKEIIANPGDSVAYHLGIRNDGNITASDVTVKDLLPVNMTYQTGTSYYYTQSHPEGVKMSDRLFTSGVSIPDMIPGDAGIVYLTFQTTVSSNIPVGVWELNNIAKVYQAGVEKDTDQAKVTVTADRGLTIDKKVSNGLSWVEQNTAKLGDEVYYRIVIKNTGNIAATDVRIRDILPVYVNYITGSTKVDGAPMNDQIITSTGLSIGNLAKGEQKVITLNGIIYGCPPVGGYSLVNTAYTWGNGISQINDSAITVVAVTAPIAPSSR